MSWEIAVTHKPTTPPHTMVQARLVEVPSNSDPSKTYKVVVGPRGGVKCPCLGFHHRHSCKHATQVQEMLQRGWT